MFKYFYTFSIGILITAFTMAQPPKQAIAFYKTGVRFQEKGMFYEAIAAYKKAISLNKKYDSAYLRTGAIYTKINKADSAIIILKNAVKVIPDFSKGYIELGNIYRDIKSNPDEAITNYLNALKTDSTNKVIFYSLAWCNNAKKYYREAIKYGIKALEIDNDYKAAYNELGHAYHQLNANEECIAQFKKNLAVSINDLPLLYTGFCYTELKQKDEALKIYEELKKINARMAEGLKRKIDAMR
ncbi:tetratricopeptide repeat protein [Ferruginibacter sp.]